jgi:hypothetical protein
MCKTIAVSLVMLLLVLLSPKAYAEDTSKTKNWDFQLAPFYLWAVNVEGDVTVRRATAPIDLDFGDIFDRLEGFLTAHFEAWYKEKWGVLAELNYLSIGDEQETRLLTLDVDFETAIAELGAFYRHTHGSHAFEPLAGIRYTSMEVRVDIVDTRLSLKETENWIDPMVGLRYKYHITDKWLVSARGDIGGFGVGSQFTWNLVGLLHFQPWKHVGFFGGYRALDVDFQKGSGIDKFRYDVLMHGPLLGFNIVW